MGFTLFEETEASSDDFARIAVAALRHLALDEAGEMETEGNARVGLAHGCSKGKYQ
jgi:hypothetical protein